MKKTAVVLFNLGGPDSLAAVQPFLENLFNDPDIFKLPFQKTLARFISKKRAPKVQGEYQLIGGKSPLGMWTELQRASLEAKLREQFSEIQVFTAMRYWHPLTQETVNQVEKYNPDHLILLPLYPHFSVSTSGSSYNEWMRFYSNTVRKVSFIKEYCEDVTYIQAINEKIDEGLLRFPEHIRSQVELVFSAHGTPVSYVKKGDPYSGHINRTMQAVMQARNHSHHHSLCFQSKVGPAKWLEPATDDKIKELSTQGKKHLLIIPISFVSDHVETLFELDIEYRHVADEAGIEQYIVMPGINDSQTFVKALFQQVMKVAE